MHQNIPDSVGASDKGGAVLDVGTGVGGMAGREDGDREGKEIVGMSIVEVGSTKREEKDIKSTSVWVGAEKE
jgi:hypothetical protein